MNEFNSVQDFDIVSISNVSCRHSDCMHFMISTPILNSINNKTDSNYKTSYKEILCVRALSTIRGTIDKTEKNLITLSTFFLKFETFFDVIQVLVLEIFSFF